MPRADCGPVVYQHTAGAPNFFALAPLGASAWDDIEISSLTNRNLCQIRTQVYHGVAPNIGVPPYNITIEIYSGFPTVTAGQCVIGSVNLLGTGTATVNATGIQTIEVPIVLSLPIPDTRANDPVPPGCGAANGAQLPNADYWIRYTCNQAGPGPIICTAASLPAPGCNDFDFGVCGTATNGLFAGFNGGLPGRFVNTTEATVAASVSGACCRNGVCAQETTVNCATNPAGGVFIGANVPCTAGLCQVPANDTCAGAQLLATLPANVSGYTGFATFDPEAPDCGGATGLVGGDGPGVWYRVNGNGHTFTASTCNAGTHFDTTLAIYCGTNCCLTCVAGNDDATPACATNNGLSSTVSWCAASGQQYYIYLSSIGGAKGFYQLTVADSGTTCSNPVTCTVATPCALANPNPPGSLAENEACGITTGNPGCSTNPEGPFQVITPLCGNPPANTAACAANAANSRVIAGTVTMTPSTVDGGITRDVDEFQITSTVAAKSYRWCVTSEFPAIIQIIDLNGGCATQTVLASATTTPCTETSISSPCRNQGDTVGFVVTPIFGWYSIGCSANCRFNGHYVAKLECNDCTGACCNQNCPYNCIITSQLDCPTHHGSNGDPYVYRGDGTTCPQFDASDSSPCGFGTIAFQCKGDTDLNELLDGRDVQLFARAVIGSVPCATGGNSSHVYYAADVNNDGIVNLADVGPFITLLLTNPPCPLRCNADASQCSLPTESAHGGTGAVESVNGFQAADDFRPTAAGSIDRVCWWGGYFVNAATATACATPDGDSPDDFTITILNASTPPIGEQSWPGTVLAGPFHVTPTKLVTGLTFPFGGIIGDVPEVRFTARLPQSVPVAANTCYWIEIYDNGLTGACDFLWETAAPGDTNSSVDAGAGHSLATQRRWDLAYCVNVNVDAGQCPVPTGACCVYDFSTDPAGVTCNVQTRADCNAAFGIWHPESQNCTTACPPISCGTVTKSQTDITTFLANSSVSCNAAGVTADNRYARIFNAVGPFTAKCVQFGVEVNSAPYTVEVKLYTDSNGGPPNNANMTQVGTTATVLVPTGNNQIITVPLAAPIPFTAAQNMVVEIHAPTRDVAAGGDGGGFFIGSSSAAQSNPSFIQSVDCGITEWTDIATIGNPPFTTDHMMIQVKGTSP